MLSSQSISSWKTGMTDEHSSTYCLLPQTWGFLTLIFIDQKKKKTWCFELRVNPIDRASSSKVLMTFPLEDLCLEICWRPY